MPLLFEEISDSNVVCFVPSGVFEDDRKWHDFRPQIAETCLYNTSELIKRLCFTTKPFSIEDSPNIQGIMKYKQQLETIEGVKNLILRILIILNSMKQNMGGDINVLFDALSQDFNLDRFKLIASKVLGNTDELEYQFKQIQSVLENQRDIHKNKLFIAALPKFKSIFKPANITPETINQQVSEYFMKVELMYMNELFKVPSFQKQLKDEEIDFESEDINLAINLRLHYRRTIIQQIFNKSLRLNSAQLDISKFDTPEKLREILKELLIHRGPLQVSGYIGLPSYRPNSIVDIKGKKAGSRELLGFKKGSYDESKNISHAVTVIGIVDNLVIFIDPIHGSKKDDRKAFAVSIDRMHAGIIKAAQRMMKEPIFLITYNPDPNEIDTTEEMLKEVMQTKKVGHKLSMS